MASQKVTFSLPKDLVARFAKRVPARERSRYVAEALATKLKEREQLLAHACEVANRSRAIRAVEQDWDVLTDEILEPWDDTLRGEIWWVRLDPAVGSEIKKTRPCVVLGSNVVNERRRTVVVVPLSSAPAAAPLLVVPVPTSGRSAVAVVDQIRAAAKQRFVRRTGTISGTELAAIEDGLRIVLEL